MTMSGLALQPFTQLDYASIFPEADRLGRKTAGKVELRNKPETDAAVNGVLYEDAVIIWIREVVGRNPFRNNQRWVETPDGYIWAPYVQPVKSLHNLPVETLPSTGSTEPHWAEGMWVEVSVPYVDLVLDNPPPRSPGLKDRLELTLPPRLYYSQIVWIDRIKLNSNGEVWYRVNERFGSYGDILWGPAESFRPLTAEEIAPISPDVEEKKVVVNLRRQELSCWEDGREVYYARISSGAMWDANGNPVDVWATPVGRFPIWRKLLSLHMSGGTTGGGWDLPGVGWVSLFVGSGVAIHSTFWHNNFGEPLSRGCLNAAPEDSKWVFRWTRPSVALEPGDASVGMPGGTIVEVVEE